MKQLSYNESLSSRSNYPPMSQSEWDSAPWNQVDPPKEEFTVTVSLTMSKDFTVKGYEGDNLKELVLDQVYLPYEAGEYLGETHPINLKGKIRDLSGWNIDDFEVI
jgi:hypothetical protein